MGYFGIHNHTEYSNLRLLDSTNKLTKLIDTAIDLGLSGIAITDHESLSGHIKAIQYQKKLNEKSIDFKVALGNEIYLVDNLAEVKDNYQSGVTKFFHFILVAKDKIGHHQLRKISSSAWNHSFYTGKMERVPTIKSELEEIIGEDKGHLIASTACIGGELAQWILNKNSEKLMEFIDWCQNVFLPENFYLEMQPNDSEEQVFVNQIILKISEQLDIPYIISTDAHYLLKDQAKVHEAYLNSREDSSRETGEFYRTCYLMSSDEVHEWMDKQIGRENVNIGLKNTEDIKNKIEFYDLQCSTIVPDAIIPDFTLSHFFINYYDVCPYIKKFAYSEDIYDKYLLKLIEDGYQKKIPYATLTESEKQELIDRIEVELSEMWKVTEKLGTSISAYYITTLDLVNTMWDEGDSFVGIARGSVTGMFTMYLIGITQLNPLPYNLKHWRHISHTKVELSDVDLDSCANRRLKIIEAIKKKRGYDKALNCCTFKTEGPKAAILTAARGLGIPNEESQFIASLIPVTRGFTWTINDCVYGNEAEDRKPVAEFVNECKKYSGLLDTALAIEGMVCGRSIHASAVYLFNSDYNDHNAMMKAPNGIDITQWNMKDSDYDGGLKEDLLTVVTEDKLRLCMDLLIENGYMDWQGSLRSTYNKYLHPDVLDYTSPEMWDMLGRGEITDIFQFESDLGKQAIKKIKPRTLVELATASSIMRLMKPSGEQPMDTYVRYKNDINEWYKSMREDYHLTEHEIHIMEKYLLEFHGVGATQEDVMLISMDPEVSGFDVKTSNLLRKGIAKKDKDLQHKMKDLLFEKGRELGTSDNLLNYVWEEVIGKQLGYSFSINHTTPYACISLQEMNLAYHYPIVYWNTACLTINAGADESAKEDESTDYGKIGVAIANMQAEGINIGFPDINKARYDFRPDEENNRIIFALKGMNGIGDDVAKAIIANRPYKSMEDFVERMLDTKIIKTSQMIKLIKGGCFTELHSKDRVETMKWFLEEYLNQPVTRLTLAQMGKMKEWHIIPEQFQKAVQLLSLKNYILDDAGFYEFYIDSDKKMLKRGYHDRYFILDDAAQKYFYEFFTDNCIVKVVNQHYVVSEKQIIKEAEAYLMPLREWFMSADALNKYNWAANLELWEKYALGSTAKWSMEALCFYDGEHELEHINEEMYGIVDFNALPEEPESYETYTRFINGERKIVPKYKIYRIAGTVLNTNNMRHTVSLLTKYGVVQIKMTKGHYTFYSKQISEDNENGKKTVLEKSWLSRGNLLVFAGIRRDDQFWPMVYNDTIYKHTVNLIKNINNDGTLDLQIERTKI